MAKLKKRSTNSQRPIPVGLRGQLQLVQLNVTLADLLLCSQLAKPYLSRAKH